MKNFKYIIMLCLALISREVFAQELVTDRPDQTESAIVVPKGSLQIESGLLIEYSEMDDISIRTILAPTTLFRLGVLKCLELRLVSQFESVKEKSNEFNNKGISDLELGIKFSILNKEDVNTQIGIVSHMVVPSGSKDLTNDKLGVINKLAFSHELSDRVGLGYNIGYNYWGRGSGDFTYSLAMGYSLNTKMGLYIEGFGEVADMDKNFVNMDAGITYLIRDKFQIDFSFGTGINHTMNYLAIGFSWNIMGEK